MDSKRDFKIIGNNGDFIVINIRGEYENHTHLKSYNTCELLIKLVCKKVVPNSPYLRTSAKRISRDKDYIDKIDRKIRKDANKTGYVNINKGVVKKVY